MPPNAADDINVCVRIFSAPHGVTEPIPLTLNSKDFYLGDEGFIDVTFMTGAEAGDQECVVISTTDDDVANPTEVGVISLQHGSGDTDSSAFMVVLHNNNQKIAVVDDDGSDCRSCCSLVASKMGEKREKRRDGGHYCRDMLHRPLTSDA